MVSNKVNILRKYLLLWIIWLGITVYLFREILGMTSVRFVVFTDRLLSISASFSPVIMWALLGLLLGAIYGCLVATKKYQLDSKINRTIIGSVGFVLVLTALINRPLAHNLINIAEPEPVLRDSSTSVQTVEEPQPQRRQSKEKDAPIVGRQEVPLAKVQRADGESSIREIKEMGGPVKVINETGGDLDLYISVYSNDIDSWKDFFLIHINSQGSPTINVPSDRYRYYVKQDGGDKYSPETPYTVSAYDGDFSTLIIK